MQSVFAKCIGSISRAKRATYLLLVGIFGFAMASQATHETLDGNPAHIQMLFQLRVWCRALIKHIRHDNCPDIPVNKDEAEIKEYVTENFAPNYKHLLIKNVFPLLGDLADSLDISCAKNSENKGKKTGFKLLGAAIKMVVGISFLQTGQAFDSFKDVCEVLHGSYDIFESVHTVESTYSFGSGVLEKALQKLKGKEIKMHKRTFNVDKVSHGLNMLEDGLEDMDLDLKANGNRLTDVQEKAIADFSQNMMKQILEFQTACGERAIQAGAKGLYKTRFFYRLVCEKLNELRWADHDIKSREVKHLMEIMKLKTESRRKDDVIDGMMFLIRENRKSLMKLEARNKTKLFDEQVDDGLKKLLEEEGCDVIDAMSRLESLEQIDSEWIESA